MIRIAMIILMIVLVGIWMHAYMFVDRDASEIAHEYTLAPPGTNSASTGPSSSTAPRSPATGPRLIWTTAPSRRSASPAAATHPTIASTALATPQFKLIHGQNGFWRLAQTDQGVWWFLSPDGKTEFLNAVTTVQPYQTARDKDGPVYVSRDWNGGINSDGNLDQWAKATLKRITQTGFKSLGAWSHPIFHQYPIPMTRDLNVWTWMTGASRRFYAPEWAALAERAIREQAELLRDNRNLVGYFIDNELDWTDAGAGPSAYFDHLSADNPNRQEVIRVIRSTWETLETFNADWNVKFTDWSELETWKALPREPSTAYERLFSIWLSHLADDYFRITTTLIRKYDANHLILGVRFKGYAPREVVRASRKYTDAQSLNYYVNDGRLDLEMFRMMYEESSQPILISEYSFHALDGRSGNRNSVGFAAQVLDQEARADGYRLFTTRLARVPYVVGADWFQWNDEPPSGRNHDGEDVNFGIVDVDDRPYDTLVRAIRETGPKLNSLHAASDRDEQTDVWRESFANKPIINVPYVGHRIVLNGELSDWPPQAKLQSIRHSQTIGLERSPLPLPNVYMGWNPEGLFLGFEVFDHDIVGAPAKGWWWTRDNVEFWISTRPIGADQNSYNPYSHQFFFVPQDPGVNDGIAGCTGQWHRAGDALADHLIPHPAVRQSVRLLADRYVVEIFLSKSALHGFDPATQPAMAFNIHIRNFQHAIDYFWSAPKEVMTQLRPQTWGTLYLEPPPDLRTAAAESMPQNNPD